MLRTVTCSAPSVTACASCPSDIIYIKRRCPGTNEGPRRPSVSARHRRKAPVCAHAGHASLRVWAPNAGTCDSPSFLPQTAETQLHRSHPAGGEAGFNSVAHTWTHTLTHPRGAPRTRHCTNTSLPAGTRQVARLHLWPGTTALSWSLSPMHTHDVTVSIETSPHIQMEKLQGLLTEANPEQCTEHAVNRRAASRAFVSLQKNTIASADLRNYK